MTADDLIGQLVLIHPEISTDPAGKAGQVGIITDADIEMDNIYVGFRKKGQGLYGADALLILRKPENIKDLMNIYKHDLSVDDYKALFQISLLQEFKQSTANTKTALSLALQSEAVRDIAMRSVENLLGRGQVQNMQR